MERIPWPIDGALCRRNRLPAPTLQAVRTDASGRRRYLDALFSDWQVHVEIDGSYHLEVRQAWADMRAALTAAGWRP